MKLAIVCTLRSRRAAITGILVAALSLALALPRLGAAEPATSGGKAAQSLAFSFKDGAKSTAWLHFEMPDFRRVVVSGRINGVPAKILVDSGAAGFIISKDMAETLGLRPTGTVTGIGVTGVVEGQSVEGVAISFDNLVINTPNATLYDMAPFAGVLNEPISALIGRDLFNSLVVDIDFDNLRVAFRDPAAQHSLPRGLTVPLQRDKSGLRGLPLSIEEGLPIQATLDFGSDRALVISPAYASDRSLLRNKRRSTTLSAGIAGLETGQIAMAKKVSIGNLSFHDVPFEVPNRWAFGNQAIVGMPIIRRMRMVIDFPHDRAAVIPTAKAFSEPFRKDRSGLAARRLIGRLQIMHVAAGSPAEVAGLHAGDEIIAINGQELDRDYFQKHPRLGSQPAGTVELLTLSNHEKIKLTLADYF